MLVEGLDDPAFVGTKCASPLHGQSYAFFGFHLISFPLYLSLDKEHEKGWATLFSLYVFPSPE
jgi:hypothetical protein